MLINPIGRLSRILNKDSPYKTQSRTNLEPVSVRTADLIDIFFCLLGFSCMLAC